MQIISERSGINMPQNTGSFYDMCEYIPRTKVKAVTHVNTYLWAADTLREMSHYNFFQSNFFSFHEQDYKIV